MNYSIMNSPLGPVLVAGEASGLEQVGFMEGSDSPGPGAGWVRNDRYLESALEQLEAYFAGSLKEFKLQLAPKGTAFQLSVWEALRRIPYGETISYGELACRIGNPKAARAVGAANGRNPIPIVIPCHRVIRQSGELGGYRWGLTRKHAMLSRELAGRSMTGMSS